MPPPRRLPLCCIPYQLITPHSRVLTLCVPKPHPRREGGVKPGLGRVRFFVGSGALAGDGPGCVADGVSPTERHACGVWSGVFVEETVGIEHRMSSSRAGSVDTAIGIEANRLELGWCPGGCPRGRVGGHCAREFRCYVRDI